MTQAGFFPPFLEVLVSSTSRLVKGFCILLSDPFGFFLRRIQFLISTMHCFVLHERLGGGERNSEITSKVLVAGDQL